MLLYVKSIFLTQIWKQSTFQFKGLGSPTGFFGPVLCQKFKHNLSSHQLYFMLFEYLCDSNKQKDRLQKK